MDYKAIAPEILSDWFKKFAEKECREVSPLYYQLSNKIAKDPELMAIAAYAKQRQPMPNLFFAAVHFLLLQNPTHELAQYYPSITRNTKTNLPFDLFRRFCLQHKEKIIAIEQTKIVQTNALNRCAYIMPILSHKFDGQTINLIDIGTSAGLTLHMDQYAYYYNDEHIFGNGPVRIESEIRAGVLPDFKQKVRINRKIGIDQNPLDIKKKENADWLKALIWADLIQRFDKMEYAVTLASRQPVDFRKAKGLDEFESIIREQDLETPLVIYHTHVLYQFTPNERNDFWDLMDKIGQERELTYLAAEGHKVFKTDYGLSGVLVELVEYKKRKKYHRIIAKTNGHANWIKWIK